MSWRGTERRAWPRVNAGFSLALAIEVGVSGSTTAGGTTINISRGGMLAAVDRMLPLRGRCTIRFIDAGDKIRPAETSGQILRVTAREGDYLVGIAFDTPLETLRVERTHWKRPRIFGRKGSGGREGG